MAAMADAWANYRGPPVQSRPPYGDDELSRVSSSNQGPRPPRGPDFRLLPARAPDLIAPAPANVDPRQFSRDAVASLMRGYRPEADQAHPAVQFPPAPAAPPMGTSWQHVSLFAPAGATQTLRRANLERLAQVQEATARTRQQREGKMFVSAFMRQGLPLQTLSERAARPAAQLTQPAHPIGPAELTRGMSATANPVSADHVTDSLTNIRKASAVATALRGGQNPATSSSSRRFPLAPAFADLSFDLANAIQ